MCFTPVSDRRRGLHCGQPASPRPAHHQPIAAIHMVHRETEQTRYWVRVCQSFCIQRDQTNEPKASLFQLIHPC